MALLSNLIGGLSLGSIYALIALGYTMVYGIAKMLNFAHGDIIMVGAFSMMGAAQMFGISPFIVLPIGALFCMLLGVLTEKIAYKPLRGASPLSVLITAIGVSYLLQSIALLREGSTMQPFPKLFELEPIRLGELTISGESIVTLCVTVVIMIGITLLINKTRIGKAMLAVSEDRGAAQLMGVNVNRTITITFAIGSALAAVAGMFYGLTYTFIGPYTGSMPGIKAFVAAVFGGIGSIPGAMVGGLLLGVIENFSKGYISTELSDGIVFAVLIVVLLVKPTGLMGKRTTEKV